MAKAKLKIGVIGLGRIGWQFHCPAIAKRPEFELIGVADPVADRRAEAERTYHCAAFADYRELLKLPGLQVVTIAAPTHLHRPMAIAALKRGLHVMLEKPMAVTAREGAEIVRTARARRRVLTGYQPMRANARFQHLRRLIADGRIGAIYQVRFGLFGFARRDDWQSLRKFGGGMLANYGAHALDQVLQLIGYDLRRVFCHLRRVASLGDAEDVVKIVIETKRGLIGEVDINQACVRRLYELEVIGTTGVIVFEEGKFQIRYFAKAALKPKRLNSSLAAAQRQYPHEGLPCKEECVEVDQRYAVDVYQDLARAIRTGKKPLVDPREPLAVLRLFEQCRRDAKRICPTPL